MKDPVLLEAHRGREDPGDAASVGDPTEEAVSGDLVPSSPLVRSRIETFLPFFISRKRVPAQLNSISSGCAPIASISVMINFV